MQKLPNHVAFIIDGNGRWAKKRGLSRSVGHKYGAENVEKIVKESFRQGIKIVTIFAFSTENWNRPKEEVDYLMSLFEETVTANFVEKEEEFSGKVKVNFLGDYTRFNSKLINGIEETIDRTKNNKEFILNLALNYGGRDEILRAVNNIIKDGRKSIKINDFANYLYTTSLPDPDLIVRTSGELRISNFMLWQCAYSEFYFPKVHWPSFNKKQLQKALKSYSKRNRRFGEIKG